MGIIPTTPLEVDDLTLSVWKKKYWDIIAACWHLQDGGPVKSTDIANATGFSVAQVENNFSSIGRNRLGFHEAYEIPNWTEIEGVKAENRTYQPRGRTNFWVKIIPGSKSPYSPREFEIVMVVENPTYPGKKFAGS